MHESAAIGRLFGPGIGGPTARGDFLHVAQEAIPATRVRIAHTAYAGAYLAPGLFLCAFFAVAERQQVGDQKAGDRLSQPQTHDGDKAWAG